MITRRTKQRERDELEAFIRLAKRDGLSLRTAVSEWRALGHKVRTMTFADLWRKT